MKIAVDAMGGDNAPVAMVEGAANAANEYGIEIVLIGNQEKIAKELSKHDFPENLISVVHTTEVITMKDAPVAAVRQKKQASINIATRMLKKKEVDGIVSSGNTGAYMTSALLNTGRIKGIERPAIATVFPTLGKKSLIMDIGANVDCKPKNLIQFAEMGCHYCREVMNIKSPEVGLLNIGEEEEKGNDLTQQTYKKLKKMESINFVGNVESKDFMFGKADIVVCDGFVGNILLKTSEAIAEVIMSLVKSEVKKGFFIKLGVLLMLPAIKRIKKVIDYDEYGGALLLGIKGVCVKAHGRANAKAFQNAIKKAIDIIEHNVIENIEKSHTEQE